MKKIVALISAFLMLWSCASAATLSDLTPLEINDTDERWGYSYNQLAATGLLIESTEKGSVLKDRKGADLSEVYQNMDTTGNLSLRVSDGKGYGVIDAATGKVLIPCNYTWTEPMAGVAVGWNMGVMLEPGTEKDCDYQDILDKNYYKVVSADVYHDDQMLATLTRDEYNKNIGITLVGRYFYFGNSKTQKTDIYDDSFRKVRTVEYGQREFDLDYVKDQITYVPTGEPAFTEGCTLKAEDVTMPYYEKDGAILDLQGKVMAQPGETYDSVYDYQNGYFKVQKGGLYGLIDPSGREVIPCVCEGLSSVLFEDGYTQAIVDGKLVFYNEKGEATETGLETGSVGNGAIARVWADVYVNENGDVLNGAELAERQKENPDEVWESRTRCAIASGAAGVFPGYYDNEYIAGTYVRASDMKDRKGVMDIKGNAVLPFDEKWAYVEVTSEGKILLRDWDWNYFLAEIK